MTQHRATLSSLQMLIKIISWPKTTEPQILLNIQITHAIANMTHFNCGEIGHIDMELMCKFLNVAPLTDQSSFFDEVIYMSTSMKTVFIEGIRPLLGQAYGILTDHQLLCSSQWHILITDCINQ